MEKRSRPPHLLILVPELLARAAGLLRGRLVGAAEAEVDEERHHERRRRQIEENVVTPLDQEADWEHDRRVAQRAAEADHREAHAAFLRALDDERIRERKHRAVEKTVTNNGKQNRSKRVRPHIIQDRERASDAEDLDHQAPLARAVRKPRPERLNEHRTQRRDRHQNADLPRRHPARRKKRADKRRIQRHADVVQPVRGEQVRSLHKFFLLFHDASMSFPQGFGGRFAGNARTGGMMCQMLLYSEIPLMNSLKQPDREFPVWLSFFS